MITLTTYILVLEFLWLHGKQTMHPGADITRYTNCTYYYAKKCLDEMCKLGWIRRVGRSEWVISQQGVRVYEAMLKTQPKKANIAPSDDNWPF